MYRIRYWYQETVESGIWCLSGLMSLDSAQKIVEYGYYEMAEIVTDSEYEEKYGGLNELTNN
jgi:hypothetical protein